MKRYLIVSALLTVLGAQTFGQNLMTLHAGTEKQVIDKNIYGHFAEHLGRCIYDGFYVGEGNKTIPNVNGVRNDVVAALKKLKIPNLRWPGGCFADTYHWKDGIGPKSKRPVMVNTWWGGITENNSFGTNDFLNMCELLGAEPYLSANVGSGTPQELRDWVQYTNFDGKSPMSNLRVANGRTKPWAVKFWGIGNEAWGCGGNMRPEYYADIFRQFTTFIPDKVNNDKLYRIASGASDDDYKWTETLMKNIPNNMIGGLAMHHYSVISWSKKGPATGFSELEYFATLKQALAMDTLITKHAAIMDKYDPQKKVMLVVDEWGGWYDVEPGTNPGFLYQQNTMRDAMIAGATLNIFNNHSDRVRMANLAQAINVLQSVILTKGSKILLTPTYHVMEMYNVHQNAKLIPLTVSSGNYTFNGQTLPAVSGSASRNDSGQTHISLVNIDAAKTNNIVIDLQGKTYASLTGRVLNSAKIQDHNTFDMPEKIKPSVFTDAKLNGNKLTVNMPPCSVVVLELK